MVKHLNQPGRIEDVLKKAPLRWMITLIGEEQSRQLATLTNDLRGRVSATGDGKKISSGFSYWGISPTIAWTRACNDPFYLVMKESIETFPNRFTRIFRHIEQQKYHYVSLGVGTGYKDRQILIELYKTHPGLFYFPVDMSPEMLRIGTQEALKGIPIDRSKVLPLQFDFSIGRNIEESCHLLNQIVGDEPILFSLLGNTLANFEGDTALLKIIAGLLRPQDRLMLEVAYTDMLSTDAIQEAIDEYSRSRAFKEFVTSALLQNTNLYIGIEDVSFNGLIDSNRAIQIKVLYQNKTSSSTRILLPDRSEIDFPVEDTIRLYLTRKYTSHGIETLLNECGFLLLTQEQSTFSSAHNSYNFGMSAMLLQLSSSKGSRRWECYGSPNQFPAGKPNNPDSTILRGDTRMTIEMDAIRVSNFLRVLHDKILADPEFGRLYADMGRVDQTFTRLATALATNIERLEEARANLMLFPTRRQYQDDVDGYLQGLSATSLEIEKVWYQFRTDMLAKTESFILRIEEERAKQLAQPASSLDEETTSTQDTQAASWLKTALSGLATFKDFLSVAVDIDKAVTQWSPVLIESAKSAFDLLKQLHF